MVRCIFNVSMQPGGGNVLVVFWLQFLDFWAEATKDKFKNQTLYSSGSF